MASGIKRVFLTHHQLKSLERLANISEPLADCACEIIDRGWVTPLEKIALDMTLAFTVTDHFGKTGPGLSARADKKLKVISFQKKAS